MGKNNINYLILSLHACLEKFYNACKNNTKYLLDLRVWKSTYEYTFRLKF